MNDPELSSDLGPKSGLLNDTQIKNYINAGYLFSGSSYALSKIKYATYEIRVSENYEIVRYKDGELTFTPRTIGENDIIVIEPGHTIKAYAKEIFNIPTNVYAKINAVGQIFSAGLAAGNTYADPGFTGHLYITLSNISSRRLSIKPNDPLARVEFHKLEKPVTTPHPGESAVRKNFVTVESDGDIRELLSSKTIEELMREMVVQSVDEALQDKHIRSEVLIEKAHIEIDCLKNLKKTITKLRWLFSTGVFLFSLAFFIWFDFARFIPDDQKWALGINITATLIASSIIAFVSLLFTKRV